MPKKLQGKGVITGIAMGPVMLAGQNIDGYLAAYVPGDQELETDKLQGALQAVVEILQENCKHLKDKGLVEQAAIMEAHRMMAQDPMLSEAMMSQLDVQVNAPLAALAGSKASSAIFEQMPDPYFRERAVDIRDVGKRIAKYILGVKEPEIGADPVILCGQEIEPSVIANLPTDKIAGVILGEGSTTCHAVIIAKSRAIPTIVGLGDKIQELTNGDCVILDGQTGEIRLQPTAADREVYQEKRQAQEERRDRDAELAPLPAETTDHVRVTLAANIGSAMDMDAACSYGCEGVGLFRSEFVFMGRQDIPQEEDQFRAYKAAVEKCQGKLCVIRTMDIGGDKPLPYLNIPKEDNPFLGWRAVRISLQREDLFLPQIKAILRAGSFGPVGIMVPMVINVAEVKAVHACIEKAKSALQQEGKAFGQDVQVGIMVETPAAAVMTPVLAKYVDFFSIGTNDLVQYTLAVDRVNHNVSYLYNHFHPAVLQLIQRTIQAGRKHDVWVGMCGEMASDPRAAVLLLAMGIHELSMSAPSIPRVKERIRQTSLAQAKTILAAVKQMEDGDEIRQYLENVL